MQPLVAVFRAEVFPVKPKWSVSANDGLNIVGQFAGEGFDDDVGGRGCIGIFGMIGLPSVNADALMDIGNRGQIRAECLKGWEIVCPQMHLPAELALQNTRQPP